jgi:hypothetical protein
MNGTIPNPQTRSPWMDWTPRSHFRINNLQGLTVVGEFERKRENAPHYAWFSRPSLSLKESPQLVMAAVIIP